MTYKMPDGFDLDVFLARPHIARVATNGPTVRPVWFLWEDKAFWWLTGSWSKLPELIESDPSVTLLIDTWQPPSGEVLQLIAKGQASIYPFEPERARRTLAHYLGHDESRWDERRFIKGTFDSPSAAFVRLAPDRLTVRDLSYRPPA